MDEQSEITLEFVSLQKNGKAALDHIRSFLTWPGEGNKDRFDALLKSGITTQKARYSPVLEELRIPNITNPTEEVRVGDLLCVQIENTTKDENIPKTIFLQTIRPDVANTGLTNSITIIAQDGKRTTFSSGDHKVDDLQTLLALNKSLSDLKEGVDSYFSN